MILSYTTPEGWFISHEILGYDDNFEDYKKAFDLLLAPIGKTFEELNPNADEVIFNIGKHMNARPFKKTT